MPSCGGERKQPPDQGGLMIPACAEDGVLQMRKATLKLRSQKF